MTRWLRLLRRWLGLEPTSYERGPVHFDGKTRATMIREFGPKARRELLREWQARKAGKR